MNLFACLLILLIPSVSLAAYDNPTVLANERKGNGTVLITFAFTGNAGEPTVTRGYTVTLGTTAAAVRNWIDDTIKELDLVRTAETTPALQPGQTVPRLAKVPPVLSAKQIWNRKYSIYQRFQNSDIAALAADRATLKADLEATYQAGFLAEE